MARETIDDVLARLTPEQQEALKAHVRSEWARKAGRAGTGDAKRRSSKHYRQAQLASTKARKRNKQKAVAKAA